MVTQIWFFSGFVLIVLEIFLPGLVVIFLGLANVTIAALRYAGIIEGDLATFGWWFVIAMAYVVFLRSLAAKFVPSISHKAVTADEAWIMGDQVEAISDINEENMDGRVRYQGTSWPAKMLEGRLKPGEKGHIVSREGIGFLIRLPE